MLASQRHLNMYLPSLECMVSKLKLHSIHNHWNYIFSVPASTWPIPLFIKKVLPLHEGTNIDLISFYHSISPGCVPLSSRNLYCTEAQHGEHLCLSGFETIRMESLHLCLSCFLFWDNNASCIIIHHSPDLCILRFCHVYSDSLKHTKKGSYELWKMYDGSY